MPEPLAREALRLAGHKLPVKTKFVLARTASDACLEMRDMNDKGLREHIVTQRRELFGLRLQHATGELENAASLRSPSVALPGAHRRAPARRRPKREDRWLKRHH